jgi:ABC-type transport system involved in cytochrome c biogenesis permease subunit
MKTEVENDSKPSRWKTGFALLRKDIPWFIYATLLHARLMRGWKGRRVAAFSIAGFGAVLFTYFGVNLLPGLHSYGSM